VSHLSSPLHPSGLAVREEEQFEASEAREQGTKQNAEQVAIKS